MPTKPIRACLYARVSTSGHGQDPQLQFDELRQVAQARGWDVIAEHVDEGVSGTKTTRPGLDAMLEAAPSSLPDKPRSQGRGAASSV